VLDILLEENFIKKDWLSNGNYIKR
jgi:hypothetical protein